MTITAKYPEYVCPEGHPFRSLSTATPTPEALPCPHVLEDGEICKQRGVLQPAPSPTV